MAGKVISRGKGNHSAVSTRRVKADFDSVLAVAAAHKVASDVRLAASASRIYETLCAVASVAIADLAVGQAARFHQAHVQGGRAVSKYRTRYLFDSDLLGAVGFDRADDETRSVFGAIKASAPDSTTDPDCGYLTADGKIGTREAARASWVEAAANRR